MKDENCYHVTCYNPECAMEFCFYCWVSFDSINWHGGMYHRQDCRNFEDYGEETAYYGDCPACQRCKEALGEERACEKPIKTRAQYLEEILELVQN